MEPTATIAFNRHLRLTAGVSISELDLESDAPESLMANALVASLNYAAGSDPRSRRRARQRWSLEAGYELRSATSALESDLEYKRHFGHADYHYKQRDSEIIARFSLGRITGRAPLFERFSLGDSSTLRGWTRFDIAPAGGNRMFHESLEYRYRGFALFVDGGSVWQPDTDLRVRFSAGFGFHHDNAFLTLAVPLNADDNSATFMMGVRF
jgi:outer membrane translocation and assembly module TamA